MASISKLVMGVKAGTMALPENVVMLDLAYNRLYESGSKRNAGYDERQLDHAWAWSLANDSTPAYETIDRIFSRDNIKRIGVWAGHAFGMTEGESGWDYDAITQFKKTYRL